MSRHDATTQPLKVRDDREAERARWRVRLTAFGIAARCEYLLDELLHHSQPNTSEGIGRVLIATRALISLTAPEKPVDSLFDQRGAPSQRMREAQRRIVDALSFDIATRIASARDELVATALDEIRKSARELLATPLPVAAQAMAPPTGRVLIVDDEPLMIALLQRLVERPGISIVTANNGADGLRIAREQPLDLILTDINMPSMTGIELLEALKRDDATRPIPVIVVSSAADMDSVSRCIELGAEDHIPKPFEAKVLGARIGASLDRKRLHDKEANERSAVSALILAAEEVEQDLYRSESVADVASRQDGLGMLARVFDRVVTGLKSREERLRRRLQSLRNEITGTTPTTGSETTPDSAFKVGTVVDGRYEVTSLLGAGGMGAVYEAKDRVLGVKIALKSVRDDLVGAHPVLVDRLKSEILLARQISHRNVVRTHDIGQWEGHYLITMELVRGISLANLLDQRGRLTVPATLAIGMQLCDALATAHEADVIHRDIKPGNLVVDDEGLLKVMDFGIARPIVGDYDAHTSKGHVVGTPKYMAPELIMGGTATAQSDLYAVGVVLYECLTGRVPYESQSPADLVAEVFKENAAPVEASVADMPLTFAKLIHQQLHFDPARRAKSARELAQKLSEVELG
jgi:CheY-like chemotaxis protein